MELNNKKFILISLEGNIGAGKSTLFQLIQNSFPQAIFLQEPVAAWQSLNNNPELNVLSKFYEDTLRWGYTFQLFALQSRFQFWQEQLNNVNLGANQIQLVFTERSLESSREIFCKNCFKQGFLNELEFALYENFYHWLLNRQDAFLTDLVIYIKTPAQECARRIAGRGRDEENTIPLAYLEQLEKSHDEWLYAENQKMSVEIIDATQNYVTDKNVCEQIVSQINKAIDKLQKN